MKVQVHSSLEPPLEYNQGQMTLIDKVSYDPYNQLGSYRNIMQFQINSRKENRYIEIPE